MKYKVGDKIKVKKNNIFNRKFVNVGDIGEIVGVDEFDVHIDFKKGDGTKQVVFHKLFNKYCKLINSKETLSEIDIYKKALELACNEISKYRKNSLKFNLIEDVENEYIGLAKQKLIPVLDEKEKEYLSAMLRPFKKRVNYVVKRNAFIEGTQDIFVYVTDSVMIFPHFKKDAMYKGMEVGKRYTLKELGLED